MGSVAQAAKVQHSISTVTVPRAGFNLLGAQPKAESEPRAGQKLRSREQL